MFNAEFKIFLSLWVMLCLDDVVMNPNMYLQACLSCFETIIINIQLETRSSCIIFFH